jgi:hypothetical protein
VTDYYPYNNRLVMLRSIENHAQYTIDSIEKSINLHRNETLSYYHMPPKKYVIDQAINYFLIRRRMNDSTPIFDMIDECIRIVYRSCFYKCMISVQSKSNLSENLERFNNILTSSLLPGITSK